MWDKTWLGAEGKSIRHYEDYESMFRPRAPGGVSFFFSLGWGIWLPSNKNIAPVLFDYNLLSAEWCNSLAKCYFFFSPSPSLSVHFACVFHLVGLGRLALNKCHFFFPPTVVSSGSFLSADPFKLSIPFLSFSSPVSLSPSLFFSTSRRVLLYSFVILIDCINLLSIEFPVHHAEHNVEYYHNPSK